MDDERVVGAAHARSRHLAPDFEQMEELPEYLRRFFDFRGGPPVPRDRAGMGSGFIIKLSR